MFRITEDPSSRSLVQCLAKNCKTDSIVSVGMDKVGVMATYSDPFSVYAYVVHCIGRHMKMELVIVCANNYAVFTRPDLIKRSLLHDFKTLLQPMVD